MVSNVQLDEKYNLVYTKENDVWEKSIIAFKERVGATSTENQLENFEKLYDSRLANTTMSSNTEVCISEHYYIQCDVLVTDNVTVLLVQQVNASNIQLQ